MNKSKRMVLVFIMLILSIGAGYCGFRYFQNRARIDKLLNQDVDPKILKEAYDINIKPCYDTPVNNREQAIAIAKKNGIRIEGFKIHTQYCLITFGEPAAQISERIARKDPVLESRHVYEGRPMWIISHRYKKYKNNKLLQMEFVAVIDDINGILMCTGGHEVAAAKDK
jgi:hypothetical protein